MENIVFLPMILILPLLLVASMTNAETKPPHTNRLIHEKSPYLLQHAHNPVDWHAWGAEAFEKAKKEDKPIFLSIGYSTCHWCHVMEEESFENEATARLMNENYISIKVDREERPDIDSVYMTYVMATTGGGGWPMTVFLTPDRKPFYGGTYFPPEDRYGMPGFPSLLRSMSEAWKSRRDEILKSAESAVSFLQHRPKAPSEKKLTEAALKHCFENYAHSFDSDFGGFGKAPKFPMGHALSFLLRYWHRSKDTAALEMVRKSLDAMAGGGVYDQLGGGFHRYSTDRQWRVPHFEKMLYDQALLSRSYLEAYQATRDERYARVAREILDFTLSEMTSKEGAFFSAQDADSLDPENPSKKREGAYYVWKKEELAKILPKEELEIVSYTYGVQDEGNAIQDPHQEFIHQNVLTVAHSADETAKHWHRDSREVEKILLTSKKKLLDARQKRPKPYLDDKVLTDWNGLMIASFSLASRVLNEPRYGEAASRAAEFLLKNLMSKDGRLLHRYRDGEAGIEAHLDDYAFFVYGCLALYEATFDEKWLNEGVGLYQAMVEEFWDPERKGFYLSSKNAQDLVARPKSAYDGAIPSGNSVAALDAIFLSRFTGEARYETTAQDIFEAFSGEVLSQPTGYSELLIALDFAVGPSYEIVLASERQDAAFQSMIKEIYLRFLPNKTTLWKRNGKTTATVCKNKVCSLPVTDIEAFKKLLE